MNDGEIRTVLCDWLLEHIPDGVIIEEMPLYRGAGRADVAVVNGSLNGFEIKSDCDTFARLPSQISKYESVFDYCYLVTGRRHLKKSVSQAPAGWGILVVESTDDRATVTCVRKPRINRSTEIDAVIRLLWKPEVVRTLRGLGSQTRANAPVRVLWSELASSPRRVVAERVRHALKTRATPESAAQSLQCGDSFPIGPTVAGHRVQ